MSEAPKHAKHAARPSDAQANASTDEQTALSPKPGTLARGAHAVTPEVVPDRPPLVQKLHDFAENRNPYTPPERLYTDRTSEEVSRLETKGLRRPFDLPLAVKIVLGASVAVAAVAGGVFVYHSADAILNADQREQAALQESLAREVRLNLPALSTLAPLDNASILATLQAESANVVDLTPLLADETGMEVVKLADDVDASNAETAAALWTGVGSLNAAEAVHLLNGSWLLAIDHSDGVNLNVRFADFTSGSAEAALAAAVTAQGLDGTATGDVTQDSSGNTIQTGSVTIADVPYQWQISVCPLDEFYGIAGMPETAMYVGVRLFQ